MIKKSDGHVTVTIEQWPFSMEVRGDGIDATLQMDVNRSFGRFYINESRAKLLIEALNEYLEVGKA